MATEEERWTLSAAGINFEKLSDGSHDPLLNVSFSNDVILILFRLAEDRIATLRLWLYQLAGVRDDGPDLLNKGALLRQVNKVKQELRLLRRDKKTVERDALLQAKFNLPCLTLCRFPAASLVFSAASAVSRAAVDASSSDSDAKAARKAETAARSAVNQTNWIVKNLQAQLGEKQRRLEVVERQVKRAKLSAANLRYKKNALRRSQLTIVKNTAAVRSMHSIMQQKVLRAEKRCSNKDKQIAEQLESIAHLKVLVNALQEEVKNRDLLNAELIDNLAAMGSETITVKEGNSYSLSMQECIVRLQALKVSQGAIGPSIETIVRCLFGRQLDSVPSRRTIARLTPVALALSHQQIAASLPNSSAATLYSDESTKGPVKIDAFVATDDDRNEFVLGLKETVDKASLTQLNCLKSVLSDIDGSLPGENVLARIVSGLKNLMSDRAATQVKFNSLFEMYRTECLPLARNEWPILSLSEWEQLCQVNAFFCNLHLLANLAEKMIECMSLLEATHLGSRTEAESCSVISLLRDVAKYFSSRSAAKWGVFSKWIDFLSIEGQTNVPSLPSFLGHRFNIVFLLAARVFQMRHLLIKFCKEYASDNPTLSTIAPRLRDPFICAQLKTLGLLDKLLTGPLWRLCESDLHILDMSGQFQELIVWLGANITDPSGFLMGTPPNFSDAAQRSGLDPCLIALTDSSDAAVNDHLPLIIKQVFQTAKRYFELSVAEYLSGGKYSKGVASEVLQEQTKSVLKTNRIPESVFGLTDWLFSRAPNMSMLTRESLVLVIKNKTFDWYDRLPKSEQCTVFSAAKFRAPDLRSLYLQRKSALIEERKKKLLVAKDEACCRQMETIKTLSLLTKQVTLYGLWMNEFELDSGLDSLLEKDKKLKALEVQLKFRRTVLKQPGDRKLFALSARDKKHTWQTLRQNLLSLIVSAQQMPPSADPFQIIGRRINHRYEQDGEERWWPGTVSRMVPGSRDGVSVVYCIVYDTDRSKEYQVTVEDLSIDRENGDFLVL